MEAIAAVPRPLGPGVGAGTLYRQFPTRADVVLAVYRHDIQRLADSVHKVLDQHHDDPLAAFRSWFERLARFVRMKHGLGDALNTAAARDIVDDTYAPATAATGVLLAGFLWLTPDTSAGRAQAKRTMDLVIAGIGTHSTQ